MSLFRFDTLGLSWAALSSAAIGIAGCATTEGDPYALPQAGTRIQLNQDLTVPAGTSRVFVQFGGVRREKDLNQFQTYCKFYVYRSTSEMGATHPIAAEEFVVDSVHRRRDYYTHLDRTLLAQFNGDRGKSSYTLAIYMRLAASSQPEVTDFICAQWGENDVWNYPTVDEMVDTLGDVVTFTPPSG